MLEYLPAMNYYFICKASSRFLILCCNDGKIKDFDSIMYPDIGNAADKCTASQSNQTA